MKIRGVLFPFSQLTDSRILPPINFLLLQHSIKFYPYPYLKFALHWIISSFDSNFLTLSLKFLNLLFPQAFRANRAIHTQWITFLIGSSLKILVLFSFKILSHSSLFNHICSNCGDLCFSLLIYFLSFYFLSFYFQLWL